MFNLGNILNFINTTSWMLIPILLCSIISLSIIIENLWVYFLAIKKINLIKKNFNYFKITPKTLNFLEKNSLNNEIIHNLETLELRDYTKDELITFLNTLSISDKEKELILKASHKPILELTKYDEVSNSDIVGTFFNWYKTNLTCSNTEANNLIDKLGELYELRINWLSTLAAISPLIGLLGTVLGMIKIFTVVSIQKPSNPIAALSGGISEALFATLGGLFVAVVSAIGYHFLMNSLEKLKLSLKSLITEYN